MGRRAARRRCRPGARSWAEELLAVAAAREEGEPLQVAVQFVQAVGRVADELC